MKHHFALIGLLLIINVACVSKKIQPEITTQELKDHIAFLASDSLKGRYPGTPEDKLAAVYIAKHFNINNLELLYNQGLQSFEITTNLELGENNSLMIDDKSFAVNEDFIPVLFTANKQIKAEVVFVGYGFIIEQGEKIWNDYNNLDVKDKWVLILRGEPQGVEESFPFSMYSSMRSKAIAAKDQGAAGVIFVSGKNFDEDDALLELSKPEGELEIPVIQVKRAIANQIIKNNGKSITELEDQIADDSNSFLTNTTLECKTDVQTKKSETYNVAAQLIIDPDFEYIVIGAHYDHLGLGGEGTGTRAPGADKVHYGADDNASGVSAVLEIAEKLATQKDSLKTNFIFAAFGAEEMGLLGSKYFVNHLPLPDSAIKTMINIDMVGRMKEDKSLQIGGVGTSAEGEAFLSELNNEYNFKLGFSQEGYGPSDHSSFYSKDIPVFFFSTGAHIDYHTPGDSLGNINLEGLYETTRFIYQFAYNVSSTNQMLTYQEAGPKMPDGNARNKNLKVTLGIMPDFSGVEDRGLRADIVVKDKPADKAGMEAGDIITAIDGYPVGDVYEYMERLSKLKPGQIITVEVIRNEQKEVLIVQL